MEQGWDYHLSGQPQEYESGIARCGAQVIRYAQGQPEEGYQVGAPLVVCPECKMRGHADRNASIKIGRKLLARYEQAPEPKEKTRGKASSSLSLVLRGPRKGKGVISSQDARGEKQPSIAAARHGTGNGHGTAHKGRRQADGHGFPLYPSPHYGPPME